MATNGDVGRSFPFPFPFPFAVLLLLLMAVISDCHTEKRGIYLVLMEGDPLAFHPGLGGKRVDPHSEVYKAHAKHVVDSHDRLLQSTLDSGSYNKLYSFKHVVNGFSVHTTPSQAKKLEHAGGVTMVERDRGAKTMTTYTPEFLGLPEGIWREEGGDENAGEGLVIGFVDTGINPQHPSFAYDPTNPYSSFNGTSQFKGGLCEVGPGFPEGSCNGKIVSARFFSAGAQAAADLNASYDFLSPLDAVGHGSHVASTAAGNSGVPVVLNGFFYGRASGMAPRARIAVYKAIYPTIGTITDVVSAIDQATMEGVDILTLSIGPDTPPEDTMTFLNVFDIFMLFARRAGVFVVQAAGNQGPAPSTVVSFSPWAVGAAASTTDRAYPRTLLLGNGQRIGGFGLSGPTFGNGLIQYKLVLARDAVKMNGTFPRTAQYVEECQFAEALDPFLVQGSVVICIFSTGFFNGNSTLTAIIDTAKTLGFMGFVLVANPNYGDFIAEPLPFSVPGILIPSVAETQIIAEYYEQQTYRDERGIAVRYGGRAAIGEGRISSMAGRAPIVSRFSSRGPDFIDKTRKPVDVLKPDILAPGHQVWAAWTPISILDPILSGYNFALLSGTSMATPHVAGIAALIKQVNPSWSPSMIASAMSSTATIFDNLGEPIMAEGYDIGSLYPSTHFDFGAGFISPNHAIDPGLVLTSGFEDYINFLCSLPSINPATIRAITGRTCTQFLTYLSDLNLPSVTISELKGSRKVRRSLKNIGSKQETYLCSVIPPKGVIVSLNPPSFTISPDSTQYLEIQLNVSQAMEDYSFGGIVLTGSLNHIVRIPISVLPVSV